MVSGSQAICVCGQEVIRPKGQATSLLSHQVGRSSDVALPRQLQEFLGTTNFVRNFCGITYSAEVHPLRKYIKKSAEFPLSPRSIGATNKIKDLVCQQIMLFVPDYEAAMSGVRPFCQVADTCGFAIGGAHTQLSDTDPPRTQVLSFKTKGLTPTQMVWPTWEQELGGQLVCRRSFKVEFQSVAARLYTDHANNVRLRDMPVERINLKHFRWHQELTADGSVLISIPGVMLRLADGPSRNPPNRDELEAVRPRDLDSLRRLISEFRPDQYASDELDDPGATEAPVEVVNRQEIRLTLPQRGTSRPQPEVQPEPGPEPGFDYARLAQTSSVARVLYLGAYEPVARAEANVAALRSLVARNMSRPESDISVVPMEMPRHDDSIDAGFWFKPHANKHKEEVHKMRVQMLSAIVATLESIVLIQPTHIVGLQQGAMVACLMSHSLMVALALRVRLCQPTQISAYKNAWYKIRSIVAVDPSVTPRHSDIPFFLECMPEFEIPCKRSVGLTVYTADTGPYKKFSQHICKLCAGTEISKDKQIWPTEITFHSLSLIHI